MDNYEFSEPQNTQFSKLAASMTFVGTAMIVLGAFSGITIFFGSIQNILTAAFYIFIGIWTRNAGQAFQSIVDTEGSDISHLMSAIGNLEKLFTLEKWIIIFSIAVFAILFFIGFFSAI